MLVGGGNTILNKINFGRDIHATLYINVLCGKKF